MGSSLALALGLKKLGKYVYVLNRDPVPDSLKFLPSSNLSKPKVPLRKFDVLVIVDCNTMERTGFSIPCGSDRGGKKLSARNTVIIDHHVLSDHIVQSELHASLSGSFINPDVSAAGELIYELLVALNVPIDKEIAINLYTAILVDTGGFRYSNTTPESLKIASLLVEAGAEPWSITKEIYEKIHLNALRLLALAFSTLEKKDRIAWITVTKDMLKKTCTTIEDTENFVTYPRKIKGIEVAIFFRENGDKSYKISLRSKGRVNVARIAERFGGGGHVAAAGCSLKGTLKDVKGKVLKAVRSAIKKT